MFFTRPNSAHLAFFIATVFLVVGAGCGASHEPGSSPADGGGGGRADGGGGPLRDGGTEPVWGCDACVNDAGFHLDAGVARSSCAADDAQEAACPETLCDGPDRWYWNGDECFSIDCGACVGADCDRGVVDPAACGAAHATCEPALCETTGGSWLWWAEECGHYDCGRAPLATCIVGMPVCDCGLSGRFVAGVGCVRDGSCGEVDPLPPYALCVTTEGTWGPFCCPSECGVACPLDCTADACDCGPGRIFDSTRGCMDGARCHERTIGETCDGAARCTDGTICCRTCGGAGCPGPATCRAPVCDMDEHTDACGNRDDVP